MWRHVNQQTSCAYCWMVKTACKQLTCPALVVCSCTTQWLSPSTASNYPPYTNEECNTYTYTYTWFFECSIIQDGSMHKCKFYSTSSSHILRQIHTVAVHSRFVNNDHLNENSPFTATRYAPLLCYSNRVLKLILYRYHIYFPWCAAYSLNTETRWSWIS